MKLVSDRGAVIQLKNSSRPKCNSHRGRTWDTPKSFYLGDTLIPAYCDTTWGFRFYFEYNGKWYSGEVWDLDKLGYHERCDILRGK